MHIQKITALHDMPIELLLTADPSEESIHHYLARGEVYAAMENGLTIGVCVLLPTRPLTLEIINIAVEQEWQNKGVGKRLLEAAHTIAKEEGYHTLEVGTGNSSIGQLAFYQKAGFRIVGVDQNYFTRHYKEPIFEKGIQCIEMIRLSKEIS